MVSRPSPGNGDRHDAPEEVAAHGRLDAVATEQGSQTAAPVTLTLSKAKVTIDMSSTFTAPVSRHHARPVDLLRVQEVV